MLTPEQLQSARKRLGITPAPTPQVQNVASEFDSAMAEADNLTKSPIVPEPTAVNEFDTEMRLADDTRSAEEHGAFLPADTSAFKEGKGILEVGKTIANIPSSALNIGKELLQGVGNIFKIPGEAKALKEESGGIVEALKIATPEIAKNLGRIPVDIVSHLAEQYGADKIAEGDFSGALKQLHRKIVNDPTGVVADILLGRGALKSGKALIKGGTAKEALQAGRESLPQPGEAITKATAGLQDKAINALEADYSGWAEATKSGAKKVFKAGERTEALNKAGTTGKTPQRVLAEHKIVPETSGTKLSTAEQAGNFREAATPLVEARNQALQEVAYSTPPLELVELEKVALENASKRSLTASETESLLNDIHSEYEALRRKYGNTIEVTDLAGENSKYWGKTKFDSSKPFKGTANYETGKSMQLAIQEVAEKAGYDDIAQLNREIGDRMEGAKFLDDLHGQTLSKGKLGKYVFMGIGASLGNTIVGKVLGTVAGDMVGQILMDASVSNPVKRIILNSIKVKDINAYKSTLDWIKEQETLRSSRLKLEAPTSMITPEPAPTKITPAERAATDAYYTRQADLNTLKLPPGSTDIRLGPPEGYGTPGPADMSRLGQFGQGGSLGEEGTLGITPFRKTVKRKNRSLKEIKRD